jgi:hypothetical protein
LYQSVAGQRLRSTENQDTTKRKIKTSKNSIAPFETLIWRSTLLSLTKTCDNGNQCKMGHILKKALRINDKASAAKIDQNAVIAFNVINFYIGIIHSYKTGFL